MVGSDMQPKRRSALKDDLAVLGIMLSFVGLLWFVCVMMFQYVALIPSAFDSGYSWRNPLDRSGDDNPPSTFQMRKMSPRERHELEQNMAGQDR